MLVAQTSAGGTTRYTQDLAAPLSQVLNDGTATYLYGHERLRAANGPWYLADALGSLRLTLDGAGAPLATASYDPWGAPVAGMIAPFGFTGELQDAGGMTYLRARWYNSAASTFTSRDSFPGFPEQPYSQHPFQYAYSNPVLWTDPSGRCVAYGNQECAQVRTWAEFEDLFGPPIFVYPRPPAESARLPQWNIPSPRQVAEWAAAFDVVRNDPRYGAGTYQIESDLFGQAELFATYFLGFSLVGGNSPYLTSLQAELDCLNTKLADDRATPEDIIRRIGILGALGLLMGSDAYHAPDTGRRGGGGWHGSGPAPGVVAVGPNSQSSQALRAYNPPGGRSIEFVFDPTTNVFAVGRPTNIRLGSPHQRLAVAIDADATVVVGGTLKRGPNGEFLTNEVYRFCL